MKKLSLSRLAQTAASRRKALKLTQVQVSQATGINRALVSRIESEEYTPSVDQLLALSEVLGFDVGDVWEIPESGKAAVERSYRIAVAGMGYVGLSLAVLLSMISFRPYCFVMTLLAKSPSFVAPPYARTRPPVPRSVPPKYLVTTTATS